MEPVQLMNQLLTQFTTKPSTEIHPTPFTGTTANNILDWLQTFDRIAVHNVWNDQKQLQAIPVYLKDSPEFLSIITRADKNWHQPLKAALWDRYHTQDQLYDMRVKIHELQQDSSLETYKNDLDTLARHLKLPEQQKIHHFIFGSSLNWNWHFLSNNRQHTTMLLPLQSGTTTSQILILILI